MLQVMRERVKVVYWIVIVTFVGLMFLVWGVGLDGGGAPAQSAGLIAKVNGRPISESEWTNRTNIILAQLRAQANNEPLNENQRVRAREQAFDQLIDETLQQAEADRMGLAVSDEEILDTLFNDPPAYLLRQFTDAQGNVDYASYQAAITDPTQNWAQLEQSLRHTLPLEKLFQRVAGQAVVADRDVRAAYVEQNTRAVAEYIGVQFSSITTENGDVDESTARAYYEAHLDEYQQPERVRVRIAQVAKEASEADEAEIAEILNEIKDDIQQGRSTFADAARSFSEDTSASSGGELGSFDRNRMVESFTEVAFNLGVGELSSPVRTQFGYHLIQVTGETMNDSGERDEIEASHILLKVAPSADTELELSEAFDSFHAAAKSSGIESAAAGHEVAVSESAAFQDGFNIPGLSNSLEGSSFAFAAQPGALSNALSTTDAYYCVELIERLPAGPRAFEEVRTLVDSAVQSEQRAELAAAQLATAWSSIEAGSSFEDVAGDGFSQGVTDTFTMRQNLPEIGFNSSFARAAMEMNVGDRLGNLRTSRGVFGLRLLWKSEFDEDDYRAQRGTINANLLYNEQQRVVQEWMAGLREAAEIEDLRNNIL